MPRRKVMRRRKDSGFDPVLEICTRAKRRRLAGNDKDKLAEVERLQQMTADFIAKTRLKK